MPGAATSFGSLVRDRFRGLVPAPALALIAVLLAVMVAVQPGMAQEAEPVSGDAEQVASELAPLSATDRSALIGRLTDEQARDLLLFYLDETAPAAGAAGDVTTAALSIATLQAQGTAIRANLDAVLGQFGNLFPEYARKMDERLGIGIGQGGLLMVIGYLLLMSAVGLAAEYGFRHLTRGIIARNEARSAETVREKLTGAGVQFLHDLLAVAAFGVGFVVIFFALWEGDTARRDFVIVVLMAILITRVTVAIVRFIYMPRHPAWRIMPADDEAAAHFVRGTRRQIIVGVVLLLFGTLGAMWGVDEDTWRLGALLSGIVFTLTVSVFLWRYRRYMIRGVEAAIVDGDVPAWAEAAAGWGWYVLAVCYVVLSFILGTYALLLGNSFDPTAAVLGFFVLFVFNPFITAIATGLFVPDPSEVVDHSAQRRVYVTDPDDGVSVPAKLEPEPSQSEEADVEAAIEHAPAVVQDRRMLRRVISVTVLVLSLAAFAMVVGIDIFSKTAEYPIAQFLIRVLLNVGVIALLGYVGWSFIARWIDRKLAEEQAKSPIAQEVEEGPMQASGTRLQTILPIIRKFIQISIAVIALMVILASMGVNIAPLIAGAGVIGLAIGFGAQTLVKDLISGLFFLMDDAFRIGEFIESGPVSGTVERFNARSLVLRGYLGAVYTVPYGDLGMVTNYSRDWVIMKLRFRVPYDTDIDMVRKIFKKIGQEMLEDEELGPNFLQPFKSQGVIKMDDSAFIVSGKFMTKPNKQWGVRKAVYERVQAAFKHYGIKFAPKRVIVDVPNAADMEDEDDAPQTPAQKQAEKTAVAAAAASQTG